MKKKRRMKMTMIQNEMSESESGILSLKFLLHSFQTALYLDVTNCTHQKLDVDSLVLIYFYRAKHLTERLANHNLTEFSHLLSKEWEPLQNYIKHLKKGTERVQIKSAKSKKSF
jgi:hypothetical protein